MQAVLASINYIKKHTYYHNRDIQIVHSSNLKHIVPSYKNIILNGRYFVFHKELFEVLEESSYDLQILQGSETKKFAGIVLTNKENFSQGISITKNDGNASIKTSIRNFKESCWHKLNSYGDLKVYRKKVERTIFKKYESTLGLVSRKFSIPMTKYFFLKIRLTPNTISFIALLFSALAGFAYSQGGYNNMLIGAFLGLFSSWLDGCDGEVARYKFKSTPLGCWIETVCDYLYYVFVFFGLGLGIHRMYGRVAFVPTVIAISGMFLSMILYLYLRKVMAPKDRPEEFGRIFKEAVMTNKDKAIFKVAFLLEEFIKRSTLPYIMFAFALLNLNDVLFITTSIGSNITWMLTLAVYTALRNLKKEAAIELVND